MELMRRKLRGRDRSRDKLRRHRVSRGRLADDLRTPRAALLAIGQGERMAFEDDVLMYTRVAAT